MGNASSIASQSPVFESDSVVQKIMPALIQFLYMLAFILFLCPINFWKKAVNNLATARENNSWDFASSSRWPFLSFMKAIILNFVFDGLIFISWFVAVLVALYMLFTLGFMSFIFALVAGYYAPMAISPMRDIFVLMLLPFQKFLSWCSKPAQQLDIDMRSR